MPYEYAYAPMPEPLSPVPPRGYSAPAVRDDGGDADDAVTDDDGCVVVIDMT
jgi:hypothetical protein